MRQIGSISNSDLVERFADHLRATGIACTIDQGTDGFRIWVHEDDQVGAARAELAQFLAEPNHERFRNSSQRAMSRIREDAARLKAVRGRTVNLAEKWSRPAPQACPLTYGLIGLSLIVAFFVGLEPKGNDPNVDRLWFSNDGTFQPILRGEVWRLISPIFLHFGLMHLLFNMLWLRDFGMQIEYRIGTFKFLLMIVVVAAFSNWAQFWFVSGHFGGMSGVVYGLFGYIWVKGKIEPESGLGMPQQTVTMMLIWYVLCVIGVIPHVANWAHGGGLLAGIAIAFSDTSFKRLLRQK